MKKISHIFLSLILLVQQSNWIVVSTQSVAAYLGFSLMSKVYADSSVSSARNRASSLFNNTKSGFNGGTMVDSKGDAVGTNTVDARLFSGMGKDGLDVTKDKNIEFEGNVNNSEDLVNADYKKGTELNDNADNLDYDDDKSEANKANRLENNQKYGGSRAYRAMQWSQVNRTKQTAAGRALIDKLTGKGTLGDGTNLNSLIDGEKSAIKCEQSKKIVRTSGDGNIYENHSCTYLNPSKIVKLGCSISRLVKKDVNGVLKEEFTDYPKGCFLGDPSQTTVDTLQGDGTTKAQSYPSGMGDSKSGSFTVGSLDKNLATCNEKVNKMLVLNEKTGKQETITSASQGKFLSSLFPGDNPSSGICLSATVENFYADMSSAPACHFFPSYKYCNKDSLGIGDYDVEPRNLTWAEFAKEMPSDCVDKIIKNPECKIDDSIKCEYEEKPFTDRLETTCTREADSCDSDLFSRYPSLQCEKMKQNYQCSMPDPWQDAEVQTTTICKPEQKKEEVNVATYDEEYRSCKVFNPVKQVPTGCTVEYKENSNNPEIPISLQSVSLPVSEYTESLSHSNSGSSYKIKTKSNSASLISSSTPSINMELYSPNTIKFIKIKLKGNSSIHSDLQRGSTQGLLSYNIQGVQINGKRVDGVFTDTTFNNPEVQKPYRIDTGIIKYESEGEGPYPLNTNWVTEEFPNGGEVLKIKPGAVGTNGMFLGNSYTSWKGINQTVPNGYYFHLKPKCRWSFPAGGHRNSIALYDLSKNGNVASGTLTPNYSSYGSPLVYNSMGQGGYSDQLKYDGGCISSAYVLKNENKYETVLTNDSGSFFAASSNESKFVSKSNSLTFQERDLESVVELNMSKSNDITSMLRGGKNSIGLNFSSSLKRINSIEVEVEYKDSLKQLQLVETPPNCFSSNYDVDLTDPNKASPIGLPEGKYIGSVYDDKSKSFSNSIKAIISKSNCIATKKTSDTVGGSTYGEIIKDSKDITNQNIPAGEVCVKAEIKDYYLDASQEPACNFITCNDSQYEFYDAKGKGFNAEGLSWADLAYKMPNQCEVNQEDNSCTYESKSCDESQKLGGKYCPVDIKKFKCLVKNGSKTITQNKAAISHCIPETVADPNGGPDQIVYNCPQGESVTTDVQSFSRVATKFSMAQLGQTDNSCSNPEDPSTCSVFKGKYYKCRSMGFFGFGGNCCRYTINASYLDSIMTAYQLSDNKYVVNSVKAAYGLAKDTSLGGKVLGVAEDAYGNVSGFVEAGWEKLSNKATATWDAISEPFQDVGNSIRDYFTDKVTETAATEVSGQAAGQVGTEVVEQGFIGGIQNTINNYLYEGLNAVSEGLGDQIFQQATTEAGSSVVDSSGTSVLEFTPGVEQAFTYFMYVYYAYVIANLIIGLLSACKTKEMEFQQKAGMKTCTQVRSTWCSNKTFFGCMEKSKGYCCYQSILSRIINVQGSSQIGKSLYNSGCSGFTLSELGQLDWSKINLSEWTNALMKTNLLKPSDKDLDKKLSMASMTGKTAKAMGYDRNIEDKVSQRSILSASEAEEGIREDSENTGRLTVSHNANGFEKTRGIAPYQNYINKNGVDLAEEASPFEGEISRCNISRTGQVRGSSLQVRVVNGLFAHRLVLYPYCENRRTAVQGKVKNCTTPEVNTGWTFGSSPGVVIRPDGSFSYTPVTRSYSYTKPTVSWYSDDDEPETVTFSTNSCNGKLKSSNNETSPGQVEEYVKHSKEGHIESCSFGLKAKIQYGKLWVDLKGDGNWAYADGSYPSVRAPTSSSCRNNSNGVFNLGPNYKFTPMGYQKFQVEKWDTVAKQNFSRVIDDSHDDDDNLYFVNKCSISVSQGQKQTCEIDLSDDSSEDSDSNSTTYKNKKVYGSCDFDFNGVVFHMNHSGYIQGPREVLLTGSKNSSAMNFNRSKFDGFGRVSSEGGIQISNNASLGLIRDFQFKVFAEDTKMQALINYGGETKSCQTNLY